MPCFGYWRVSALPALGESRVRRMWRALQLHIPRRRLCRRCRGIDIRLLGVTQPNLVWSSDFAHDQLVDGRALKMLCVIDEYSASARRSRAVPACGRRTSSRRCLALIAGRTAWARSECSVGGGWRPSRRKLDPDWLVLQVTEARVVRTLGAYAPDGRAGMGRQCVERRRFFPH